MKEEYFIFELSSIVPIRFRWTLYFLLLHLSFLILQLLSHHIFSLPYIRHRPLLLLLSLPFLSCSLTWDPVIPRSLPVVVSFSNLETVKSLLCPINLSLVSISLKKTVLNVGFFKFTVVFVSSLLNNISLSYFPQLHRIT